MVDLPRGSRRRGKPVPKWVRGLLVLAVLAASAYFGLDLTGPAAPPATREPGSAERGRSPAPPTTATTTTSDNAALREAMESERSGVMLTVVAEVLKALPDDNDGSRHQRFLLRIEDAPYATLLVAHNIDLAARVPLRAGDEVTVRGQYEWNEKGGVVHWTHHDPGDRREGGWILHKGDRYE